MWNRRRFFRGVSLGAGGLFFAPFLRQVEAAVPAPIPARVVFFLQGNGLYPDQVQPPGIERPREPDRLEERSLSGQTLSRSLEPLEPFRDRLTLIQGLSGRLMRSSHSCDFGALGCYPANKGAYGETIDAAMAKALPGIFPHIGLGVTNRLDASVIYNISAWDRDKKLPTQCRPDLAYKRLFASAATGDARKAFDAKTQVLDFLADDVRRMQSQLNSQEKAKLDYYLHAFESMSGRQSALLRSTEQIRRHAPRPGKNFAPDTNALPRLEAQFDVALGALAAGLTNVLTISSGSGLEFSGITVDGAEIGLPPGPVPAHAVGHGNSFLGKSSAELHVAIRRRHMELLAGFLAKLAALPECEGTMLDNTLVLYTSDHGDGHHPVNFEWPFVLVGDLGGRLDTGGRFLRYPWYGKSGHRTVANLYTTLLHAVSDRRSRFGLPDPALQDLDQDGPLETLLV